MAADSPKVKRLRASLHSVQKKLDSSPLNTAEMQKARALISANKGATEQEIELILEDAGLPSVQEVGRIVAKNMFQQTRLNKKKRRLEARLRKASRPEV